MMKMKKWGRGLLGVGVFIVSQVAPSAVQAGDDFLLPAYTPGDVFLVVNARTNPEQEFVRDYWKEVFDAVHESGISEDIMGLLNSFGAADPDHAAKIEEFHQMGLKMFEAVEWSKLAEKEFLYAMRMPKLEVEGNSMHTGGPESIWIFRGTEASSPQNFTGLANMAGMLLEHIGQFAGAEFKLNLTDENGIHRAEVRFEENGFGWGLQQKGDIIVMTLGDSIADEVAALLLGKGSAKSIAANARYRDAFAALPKAEDETFFFDMQRMLGDIREITNKVFASMGVDQKIINGQTSEGKTGTGSNPEALKIAQEAYEAYQAKDVAKALELINQALAKDNTDSVILYNAACFNALQGNKEKAFSFLDKAVEAGFYEPTSIKADADLKSLHGDPRFGAAINEASEPVLGPAPMRLVRRIMNSMSMIDYVAVSAYTDGFTTMADSHCVLTSHAKSQAIYKVFGDRKPLSDFAKFLPQETQSFSVSGGIDIVALYDFVHDSISDWGADGVSILGQWDGIQAQVGFSLRDDILSWIQGDGIQATINMESGTASVMMIRVSDDEKAAKMVGSGIDAVAELVQGLAAQNPMMSMMAIRTSPATNEKLAGFKNVFIGMTPKPAIVGVKDGYIFLSESEEAVLLCLETAAGEHPNVTKNEQVMSEALAPSGSFRAVTFEDLRGLGQQISEVLQVVQMVGGMAGMAVPPQYQPVLGTALSITGKLIRPAGMITFFKSSAGLTTFDGTKWVTKQKVNYFSPLEREASTN